MKNPHEQTIWNIPVEYSDIYTRTTILRFFATGWDRKLKITGSRDEYILRRAQEAEERYSSEVWK